MPLGVLGVEFPSVQQRGAFSDAQDSGRRGGGNNPGCKTQEPGSNPCLAAELLGHLRPTEHYLFLGLSFFICQIEVKTPPWLR